MRDVKKYFKQAKMLLHQFHNNIYLMSEPKWTKQKGNEVITHVLFKIHAKCLFGKHKDINSNNTIFAIKLYK